jgi:hypothetical protein
VGCDKKAQYEPGPVMDIAHQREGKNKIRQPQHPHDESKLEESGDKTDKKKNAHSEIQTPSDNLHVHDLHTLFCYISGYVVKGDGSCGIRPDARAVLRRFLYEV